MTFTEDRLAAVDAVRSYVGTPWAHQGRLKDIGVDCIGLAIVLARAAGAATEDELAQLPSNYGRIPHQNQLRRTIENLSWVLPVLGRDQVLVGDLLLGAWKVHPTHLIIAGNRVTGSVEPPFTAIHAQNDPWAPRIVEEPFEWNEWRITSSYRFTKWG